MKLQLEYGVFLLSMSLISSLMLVGVGKCIVVFVELMGIYLSLRAF